MDGLVLPVGNAYCPSQQWPSNKIPTTSTTLCESIAFVSPQLRVPEHDDDDNNRELHRNNATSISPYEPRVSTPFLVKSCTEGWPKGQQLTLWWGSLLVSITSSMLCPSRFYAVRKEAKLIISRLLLEYDIKWAGQVSVLPPSLANQRPNLHRTRKEKILVLRKRMVRA